MKNITKIVVTLLMICCFTAISFTGKGQENTSALPDWPIDAVNIDLVNMFAIGIDWTHGFVYVDFCCPTPKYGTGEVYFPRADNIYLPPIYGKYVANHSQKVFIYVYVMDNNTNKTCTYRYEGPILNPIVINGDDFFCKDKLKEVITIEATEIPMEY